MRISESKIEEIRSAANIADVISPFIELRKRGKNLIGLCPFHNEKTPSFTVSEEKQIFHCFGCHAGGNVFKFLMEYEKISFVEAVQELAEQLGINLEIDQSESIERHSEQEILYDINSIAGKYFSDNLLRSDSGLIAKTYFEDRKIKLKTMREFGLGYSLPGRSDFVDFAREKKIDVEHLLNLGLIGKSNDGRLFDKFSGRIIFPIFSPNGRVVAFAGRILESRENAAKYLNSPESPVYHKGRILYGLSHAKDEIRKLNKAILVEGYMDLLALYQNGIKNVVAVSGTALTEDQVQLLSRYTKNVILLFDADAAGIKASMRSIELLLKRDMEIKIVSLPSGEDPDSFVNKFGRERFEEMIEKSENFLEYQTRYYQEAGMFNEANTAAEAIRELVKPLSLVGDELKRNFLVKKIAKSFNLREKLIESELAKHINTFERRNINETKEIEKKAEKNLEYLIEDKSKKITPADLSLERELITLLLEGDEKVSELILSNIHPEDFLIELNKKIALKIQEAISIGEEIIAGSIIEKFDDEKIQSYILEITFDPHSISKSWEKIHPGPNYQNILLKAAADTIKKFKIYRIEKEIIENRKKLAEANGDSILKLLQQNTELEQLKKQVREEFSNN
jgi:DNA primase